MYKRGFCTFIVFFFISSVLWSHAAQAENGWPRTIQGINGSVTLPQPPKRIVSTSVTLTGSLLAIDAPVIASGATAPNSRLADAQGFFRQWGEVAKQRGVKRLYIGEPSAEAIAAEAPDLIVVSATGNDSAIKLVDQLSAIAPTLVVNYDDKSWQQLVGVLGEATGHEAQAAARIKAFDDRENALKSKLTLPPQPVSAMVWNGDGRAVNLWTAESAQGKLLQQLGFELAAPPTNIQQGHSMGQRKDIIQLSGENLAAGLNGNSYMLFAAEDKTAHAVINNPFLAQTSAVKNKQVYALGLETFRLDYYSASRLLTRLEQLFVKS
ncbi:MAG: Fe2+-enterobactin ABC transporter substrate-binding protein [Enterobacterales bacterium endosymbiont of Blomia tropicalis]|uniref:Fe2+-enterobactin ABC transporter substrate-binding protein n=1 Tax=Mixta mediterraneensis TaxID=2758443 RepID=UPI0025A894D7|nr:Fe2+-enterobactin ABC transporter substrate-binding protein [Mixta mediterraneensis]MDL4912729.1 Fe2+-enterobactin ABC transporter substrate-binding protein [Mixta mediterraneensis]